MPVIIEIGLLLVLLGGVFSYFTRGRRISDRQSMTDRRVEAYIETIRRERSKPELVAMSDTELRDLLLSSAHNLKVQRDRRNYLLFGGVIVGLIGAILVATEDGYRGFGVALLVAALVLYGINEFIGRQMVAPLLEKGIDVERLRVE
jgi:H2-forming N5,N10-methylenetetrahydromethanopterin dehydrogenase-like enzyme